MYHYSHALVRGLPSSFEEGLKLHPPPTPIDVKLAHKQHEKYTELIKELVKNVEEVQADEQHPDCVFIEDTAVIVGTKAICTHPGAVSRRGEVPPVKQALSKFQFLELHELTPPATLDGGDVMYTGSALWVGLTSRSNQAAIDQLQAILGVGCPVFGFTVHGGDVLHLKSAITAFDEKTLIVADNEAGRGIVQQAEANPVLAGKHQYVFVPDMVASNILRIGDHVVAQDGFPESEKVLAELCKSHGVTMHTLEMGEMIKADGALTCCSLLFKQP